MKQRRVMKAAALLCLTVGWYGTSTGTGGDAPGETQATPAAVRNVWSGVYTPEQADRGQTVYAVSCQLCHGVEMHGGPGVPGVAGPEFMFNWNNKSAAELFTYLRNMMPPGQAGSLSDQQYADLMAAILLNNGFPVGASSALSPDPEALKQVLITREKP